MTTAAHGLRHADATALRVESDRLIQPFLRWIGKRPNREAIAEAGIGYKLGCDWLSGRRTLPQREQAKVRAVLGDEGGSP